MAKVGANWFFEVTPCATLDLGHERYVSIQLFHGKRKASCGKLEPNAFLALKA